MKASLCSYFSLHSIKAVLLIFSSLFTAENLGVLWLMLQVKNDDFRRTVLNSVVGTLDVCVRHPLHGEKFPEEPGRSSLHCRIYQPDQPKFGYLTNVCVAKYARRQGIASNMLLLAIDAARINGAENIYIHVHKDNLPAWSLYNQIGFKMVDQDGARHASDLCLLSFGS